MKDDLKYIDELYKSGLAGLTESADSSVWRKLYLSLLWMRYKWFLIIGVVLLILGLGGYGFYNNAVSHEASVANGAAAVKSISEKTSNKHFAKEPDSKQTMISKSSNNPVISYSGKEKVGINDSGNPNKSDVEEAENTEGSRRLQNLSKMNALNAGVVLAVPPDTIIFGANRNIVSGLRNTKQNGFLVSLFGGPSMNRPVISGYDAEYIDYRNSHEQSSPGWSAGVDIKYRFKHWSVGTGLTYSVYRQYYDYQNLHGAYNPDNSYFEYDTTWMWVYDPPVIGKPIVKGIDSTWVKVYDESKADNSGYNEVGYFEIPVMIGYHFNVNRFIVEINMGASVGFLHRSTFNVPDFNDYHKIITVTNVNTTMFNYIASATIYYQLSDKLWLFASPYYKQNLHSVFNKDYPVDEHFKTFGLNLGVSFGL